MYQVILSINNNEEVAVLPAVPTDLGPQLPPVSYTHLTLPTKAFV